MTDDIDAILREEFKFSGVCIDENLKVVYAFGDLSKYLKQDIFNFNLIELLLQPLAMAFGAALDKAKLNKKMLIKRVKLNDKGKAYYVNLLVRPFFVGKTYRKLILVVFNEDSKKTVDDELVEIFEIEHHTSLFLNNLQNDLKEARQNLDMAYERIESSNENLQSFNEELLSANEKMQSANEELQSVNEELQTINTEHQLKIKELTDLNDDLNNYFRSNVNGQLFVDNDLLLKKYSPGAVKHINIKERDIGRPISNITTNIKFESLIEDIKAVIATGDSIVKEVVSSEKKVYQVMTIPYIRQFDNQANGAIITFYDITELKRVQSELDSSNKSLMRINEDLDNFVYGASHDLIAPILNIESMLGILNSKMDLNDPTVKKFTEAIGASIEKFKAVIKDLAVIGRIEADMINDFEDISFEEIVDDIRISISDTIKSSKAAISYDFQQKDIKFSKKNLRSILISLISNAIKFKSSRNPEIVIRTERKEGFTILSVKDNGIGMEEAKIEYIFKMYRKLNSDIEGQGIGLYLVRKIVDASGGKVEVESQIDVGSTFKIYFKY